MKGKISSILQELDSDDELPDSYTDVEVTPAYLADHRFEEIKFSWIKNDIKSDVDTQSSSNVDIFDKCNKDSKDICIKGVLKYQDIYCLKAIQPFTCNSTLLWFVNFLLQKDLQSQYKYFKSCLVNDHISLFPCTNKSYKQNVEPHQACTLEIVIK